MMCAMASRGATATAHRRRRRRPVRARVRSRARRLGHEDWAIYEAADRAGGHAGVGRRPGRVHLGQGGHVVFSHFGEFDRLLDEALGDDVHEHERSSYVRVGRPLGAVPVPEQPALSRPRGRLRLPRRPDRRAGRQRRRRLRDLDGAHVRRGHHAALHAPVQPQGLGDAGRADVGDVDRRARQRRRPQARAAEHPARARRRRLGAEQHVQVPALRRHRRDLPPARRPARRARAVRARSSSGSTPSAARSGSPTGASEAYDALVSTMPIDRLVAAIDDCPVRRARGGGVARAQRRLGRRRRRASARSPTTARGSTSPTRRCRSTGSRTSRSTPPRTSRAATPMRYSSYMTETAYSRTGRASRDGLETGVVDGARRDGADRRDVPIVSVAPDRRRLRVSDPDARAGRRARGRPAVADGARDLLARPLRLVALRDRQHGPRREDGHRRGPAPRRGPPRGGVAVLSRRSADRARRDPLLAPRRRARHRRAAARRAALQRGCRAEGSSSRGRSGCSPRRSRSGCSRASTSSPTGAEPRLRPLVLVLVGALPLAGDGPRPDRARRGGDAALARGRGGLHRRVLRLDAAPQLRAGRLADGEADGHGARQRRQQERVVPAPRPLAGGNRRQLLLLRPLPGRVPRPDHGRRPGRRLQPRRRALLRARHGGGLRRRRGALRGRAPERRRAARSPVLVGLTAAAFATAVGNIAGGLQLLDERGPPGQLRLVGAVARDRRHRERVPVLQLPARRPARARDGDAVRTRRRRVRRPARRPRAARLEPTRWRRPAAELLLAGARARLAVRDEQLRLPDGVRDRRSAHCSSGRSRQPGRWRRALVWGAAWLGGAVVLFLPFWRSFSAADDEHRASSATTLNFSRFARDYLYIYGLSLWVVLALFAGRFRMPRAVPRLGRRRAAVRARPARAVAAGGARGGAPASPPLAAFVTLATRHAQPAVPRALAARRGRARPARERRARLPARRVRRHGELPLQHGLQDRLPGVVPARDRRGVGVYWSARWLGRRLRIAWLTGLGGLVALALAYPVFALVLASARFEQTPTLDGMRWLERTRARRRRRDRVAARARSTARRRSSSRSARTSIPRAAAACRRTRACRR